MTPLDWRLERLSTPLGELLLVSDEAGRLRAVDWRDHEPRMHRLMQQQYRGRMIRLTETDAGSATGAAVSAYFNGALDALESLQVAMGGTDFQRQVWTALRDIPVGQTVSYRALAIHIGRPSAMRAVGLANGANPISLVVPCHRVIGSNDALTGYAGGLQRKRWLLEHERAIPVQARLPDFCVPEV